MYNSTGGYTASEMKTQEFDFYNKTSLKTYNLDDAMKEMVDLFKRLFADFLHTFRYINIRVFSTKII
mgnify:CR=1 FL=1